MKVGRKNERERKKGGGEEGKEQGERAEHVK